MDGVVKDIEYSTALKIDQLRNEAFSSIVARRDPHCQLRNFDCCYALITRTIESVDVTGMTNLDFRAEYSGLIFALADIFYSVLNKRSPMESAELLLDVLNVKVEFPSLPRQWSSLSVRSILQACLRLRIRQWTCVSRGVEYPDAQVNRDITHSTYLDVPCYFSFVSHLRRVWDDRHYEGGLPLQNIIEHLIEKFGEDLHCQNIDHEISFVYGSRAPINKRRQTQKKRPADQRSLDEFFPNNPDDESECTRVQDNEEHDEEDDGPPLIRHYHKRRI